MEEILAFDEQKKKAERNKGVHSAEVISVIQTKTTVGEGTKENPARYHYQYWSLDGALLATRDSYLDDLSR